MGEGEGREGKGKGKKGRAPHLLLLCNNNLIRTFITSLKFFKEGHHLPLSYESLIL